MTIRVNFTDGETINLVSMTDNRLMNVYTYLYTQHHPSTLSITRIDTSRILDLRCIDVTSKGVVDGAR
jgi:hypothetical protein